MNQNTPLLSVIVPVFNGLPIIKETIDSILGQSFSNFELIAIDDGSEDGSWEYLCGIEDPRMQIVRQENAGLCVTMNHAVDMARASIIARCDQDDLCFPDRFEKQFNLLQDQKSWDCVFSHYNKFGKHRMWQNTDVQVSTGNVRGYDPDLDVAPLHSTMMVAKESFIAAGRYRSEFYPADDYDLTLRLHKLCRIGMIEVPLVAYRFHAKANTWRIFAEMLDKSRWAKNCFIMRQDGRSETSFDKFIKSDRETSNLFRRKLHYAYQYLVRAAGARYLDGETIRAIALFAVAATLRPGPLVQRVIRASSPRRRMRNRPKYH